MFSIRIAAWIRDRLQATKPQRDDYLLPMVKHFEGYYPNWYKCSSGVDTIGYGHTGSMVGLKPAPWSEPYASEVLRLELDEKYTPLTMEACAKVGLDYAAMPPAQQAALVSAVYNSGPNIILKGTWAKLLASGKSSRDAIENAFCLWNKSGHKTSPGLVRRRFAEMVLFWEGRLDTNPEGWKRYYELHS